MKTLRDTQWSNDGLSRELSDWELLVEAKETDLDPDGDILYVAAAMLNVGATPEAIGEYVARELAMKIEDAAQEIRND